VDTNRFKEKGLTETFRKPCRFSKQMKKQLTDIFRRGPIPQFIKQCKYTGERGRRVLFRTAAAFVRVMTGIEPRVELLSRSELVTDTRKGGLFVVGSYVPKTTDQVRALLAQTDIEPVEVRGAKLMDAGGLEMEFERTAVLVNTHLGHGVYRFPSLAKSTPTACRMKSWNP
jgi:hypothetical protein